MPLQKNSLHHLLYIRKKYFFDLLNTKKIYNGRFPKLKSTNEPLKKEGKEY